MIKDAKFSGHYFYVNLKRFMGRFSNLHQCTFNGAPSTNPVSIYLLKSHHCSFKVYPMLIFKAFWIYSSSILLFSFTISLVFHKSFLLYQFSLHFLLVLYQVNSAQAIIHLQVAALASTMK